MAGFGECGDVELGTVVGFRVPGAIAKFEVEAEDAILEFAGGNAVLVGNDEFGILGEC